MSGLILFYVCVGCMTRKLSPEVDEVLLVALISAISIAFPFFP